MIHTSPLPEITVPDKLLTPYVLQRADHLADTPALVEGALAASDLRRIFRGESTPVAQGKCRVGDVEEQHQPA